MAIEPRNNIRLEVYNDTVEQELLTYNSVNMSSGGVFVETDNIQAVDTPLVIKFKLPGTDAVIVSNARVAWTNEPGNLRKLSLPPGMGIQFLDISLENPIKIRNFLK